MPNPEQFRKVIDAVAESVPADVELSAVEIRRVRDKDGADLGLLVELVTPTPGLLIGRRGTTADALRDALADRLGEPTVQLGIRESQKTPPPRWPPF